MYENNLVKSDNTKMHLSLAPHDISLFLFFANSPITKLHYNGAIF